MKLPAGAAVLATSLFSAAAYGSPVFSEPPVLFQGFEPATAGCSYCISAHGPNRIVNDSVWQPAEGTQSYEIRTGPEGSLGPLLPGFPAMTYLMRFSLAGNPTEGAAVKRLGITLDICQFGSCNFRLDTYSFLFDTTGKTTTDMGWTDHDIVFWVPQGGGLRLNLRNESCAGQFFCRDQPGPVIDNIRVYAIPEPPMTLLLVVCVLLLGIPIQRARPPGDHS
jgi:hypothetical protein